jgi:heme-degrading monooxygenase HmoA
LYHHITLFRLKPGVTLDRVRAARENLSRLVETLPGVVQFTVTDNVAELNQGFTMVLFSMFESEQAHKICHRHPEYRRVWSELLEPVIEDQIVAEGLSE